MTSGMMSSLHFSIVIESPDFLGPSGTYHFGIEFLRDVVKLGQNNTGTLIYKDA